VLVSIRSLTAPAFEREPDLLADRRLGEPMIEVEGLRKQYDDLVAVDDVNFVARPGEIFGLLGPNGAGKSTTIGCVSGLLQPTAGRIRVLGHDVTTDGQASRARLGVVPQELAIYEDLSARENLAYWGAAYGLRGARLKELVAAALTVSGLADRAKEPVRKFSGGLKRRVNFACGIVHRPAALLLDEPTVGVDPQTRVRLLDLVREQAASGAIVIYTTHYMEEAEKLCDRLAVIDHGKIIAEGTLQQLRALLGEKDLVRVTGRFDCGVVPETIRRVPDAELVNCAEDLITLAAPEASKRLPDIFRVLSSAGFDVRETTITQPSLESLFIKLTGKELRE
jgi:ABC-2 type transport system ATP-binding protein